MKIIFKGEDFILEQKQKEKKKLPTPHLNSFSISFIQVSIAHFIR